MVQIRLRTLAQFYFPVKSENKMEHQNNTVQITWNQKTIEVPQQTLLATALGTEQPCGGHGLCGKCKVLVKGSVSPISDTERQQLTETEQCLGVRLACCTYVQGDCTVEPYTAAHSVIHQVLSNGQMPSFLLAPVFKRYGVAVDIGTTTLAARLYSTDGVLRSEADGINPQAKRGADVISRIEAALRGEAELLATDIRDALDQIMQTLAQKAQISCNDIDGVVLTGNTAMLYFLTETSPKALSHAPFTADRLFDEECTAAEIGLKALKADCAVYLPPCAAAFLGADLVCALLATQIDAKNETTVLADIGTNGEMALYHNGVLRLCSTAAGPAFEGVGISMGMRGATGAIDRVYEADDRLCVHVIGEEQARGICGSGLVDAVACLLTKEEIDETGRLEQEYVHLTEHVTISAQDIRMVQLAKSAICAGIITLLKTAGTSLESVAALIIAGGFGNYLNIEHAGQIGLLPSAITNRVRLVGNAALDGASMLLLNRAFRQKCVQFAREAQVVELSSNPIFAEEYMMGMMFE